MAALSKRIIEITKKNFNKVMGIAVLGISGISGYTIKYNVILPSPIEVFLFKATIHSGIQGNESNTKDKQKTEGPNDKNDEEPLGFILNLEEVVKKRAYNFYKAQQRSIFKRKPVIALDWSDVEFYSGTPNFIQLHHDDVCTDMSKIVLENNTEIDQQHKLKTDMQTYWLAKSFLTQGYTIGPEIGLSLILSTDNGFRNEIILKHVKQNTNENISTSVVEDFIKVPRQSSITVSKIATKIEKRYSFSSIITVRGKVIANFYDQRRNLLGSYEIPMQAIIVEEFPDRMIQTIDQHSEIQIRGKCSIKFICDKRIINRSSHI